METKAASREYVLAVRARSVLLTRYAKLCVTDPGWAQADVALAHELERAERRVVQAEEALKR